VLTGWAPQEAIRRFGVRFQDVTRIGDVISYSGTVVERSLDAGAVTLRVQLQAEDQNGRAKTVGEAIVTFPKAAK